MAVTYLKKFESPEVNVKEILRYAGQKEYSLALDEEIQECLKEAMPKLSYNVCFARVECRIKEGSVTILDTTIHSNSLAKNLIGCNEAVLFSCTIGLEIDRLIEKYQSISSKKSLLMHAIGVERVEALADAFCDFLKEEIAREGMCLMPRFSPGYGDFSIEYQELFFSALESRKLLGLTLNDSLMMSPSKSVTAIIGIGNARESKEKCRECSNLGCEFRR